MKSTAKKPKKLTPKKGKIPPWVKPFLSTLRKTANVKDSCEVAKIARRTAYDRRETDLPFADSWDEAVEEACDNLETIAWERARKSSDLLLIFLLKAHRRHKYGDHAMPTGVSGQLIIIEEVVCANPPKQNPPTPSPA